MYLKIMGSLLIMGAASYLGYTLSGDFAKRPAQLRALQGQLQMLENEIGFMSNLLIDAFEKIYKYGKNETGMFFIAAAGFLKESSGVNASGAWEMALKENIGKTSLNKEDAEILYSFGRMLGNTDCEGQINNIRLTVSQLKMQELKAEDSRVKNEKMYRSLGVLGGLALVIILL